MSKMNSAIVNKICKALPKKKVDWNAIDEILDNVEDLNAYDEDCGHTYLSDCIMCVPDYHNGVILPELIRRFLAKGYDVTANDGANGGLALESLCWSSYDAYVVEAAKVLLQAGAPLDYPSDDDELEDGESPVEASIGIKLSGAWSVDKDYTWANIMETYYQVVQAYKDNRPFEDIQVFTECIGKNLERTEVIGTISAEQGSNQVMRYDNALVLWFDGKPLVISKFIDMVINPVEVAVKQAELSNATDLFEPILGAVLTDITYVNSSICYLDFDNGKRLILSSVMDKDDDHYKGLLEIRDIKKKSLAKLSVDKICRWEHIFYSPAVTSYQEEALALFANHDAYILFNRRSGRKYQLDVIPCSPELLEDYIWTLPVEKPERKELCKKNNKVRGICYSCGDLYLYLEADEDGGVNIKLSQQYQDISQEPSIRHLPGIHMEFGELREPKIKYSPF